MRSRKQTVLVTGATGYLGLAVLTRLLRDPALRAWVLVRDPTKWATVAARARLPLDRTVPIVGDVRNPGLGVSAETRAHLGREVTNVVHAAADIVFSRSLDVARATNVEGTRHALDLADSLHHLETFVYISTAFVAGRQSGRISEHNNGANAWVNYYEQSKHEAEALVRGSRIPWIILRPSTIVCDSPAGRVTQFNAVHHALSLLYASLVPMMPGTNDTLVDAVPLSYVADAVVRLALCPDLSGQSLHLCAGSGALPLAELLDLTWSRWSEDPAWRRRAIPQPVLADTATYRLFEESVQDTGDESLKKAVRALSYFAPQLALPKEFDTRLATLALGAEAPEVRRYWPNLIRHLQEKWAEPAVGAVA